ncbi:ubiquitin-like modifier-activating enzyme 1 isoform X1 [Artemia franciscana]|uniref:ubiquitin-like modifier-activating enzyme 1 isoform X1 n=1 Tax=Artemia franciscana TaxID=6661 RepID=UPI0032DBEF78
MSTGGIPSSLSPPAKRKKVSLGDTNVIDMADGTNGSNNHAHIDESLYSRQLYVLGHEAMHRMATADVLISGMRGLGVEVAKNVILAGVRSVTVHDEGNIVMSDLSSQFFFREEEVGQSRADICVKRLGELNSYVPTTASKDKLTAEFIKKFKVVVLTSSTLDEQLQISKQCRENNIALIIASNRGLFGQVFCDFGDQFTVIDTTGDAPQTAMIASITKDEQGVVTCLDEVRHGFVDGDYVTFSEVQGMEELNSAEPRRIEVTGPYTFKIGDTRGFSDYKIGGIATEAKMPKRVHFEPLEKALNEPLFLESDFSKFDRPPQLHLAYRTLHEYIKKEGCLPKPWCKTDGDKFAELAAEINSSVIGTAKVDEVDGKLMRQFANIAAGDLCPMDAFMGGVVAQEVMKAVSEKFHPIVQWFYFDALECLPCDRSVLTEENCSPQGSRYDGQIAVFGRDFQKKLEGQKWFVVGAGAIGCELLKNFALMGLGCGRDGKIFITDMDLIERSNLNRQFLFRPWDVQKAKSVTAAEAVKVMNPAINIVPQENKVGLETEGIYDDDFFSQLNGVANALDNIDARLYMDRRCVFYEKPLLESGTLGTKGNTQVVIPHLTESYGASQDPPEKEIPICTLKNFPNAIEHTLQWARDLFAGLFKQAPENAALYLMDPTFVDRTCQLPGSQPVEALQSVVKALVEERPEDYKDCVKWARHLFGELYHNQIAQLLYNFPKDQLTKEGAPFWAPPKRCPHPLDFDSTNKTHLDFIISAANLKAVIYGLQPHRDLDLVKNLVDSVEVPTFVPQSGVRIAVTDAEAQAANQGQTDTETVEDLKKSLPPVESLGGLKIFPQEFEKDDDSNFHMDFIVSASNLRAENYGIAPADRHKSKLIAGKIIPAIATTTSVVSGLVSLELYKIVQGHSKLEDFKNSFINLALPLFVFSDPIAAQQKEYNGEKWTLWDRFQINHPMTLKEFIEHFERNLKLKISMLSQGVSLLYSFFMQKAAREERMQMLMPDIVRKVSRKPIEPHVKSLVFEICCDDENGEDVEVPFVVYHL